MYDQSAGGYVCRHDQLVRHVPVASVPAPLNVRPPLRILGVISSPRSRDLAALNVEKEQDQLGRALARAAAQGLIELHWAPAATWAELQDLLLGGEWHVVHFIGHGSFDPRRRGPGPGRRGRARGLGVRAAAHQLLRPARPMPRLAVLNSCSGAVTGATDLFSGTAAALVRGGVSAVAAMQYTISDPAAIAFARGFYTAIAHGRGVDDAISSGRVAILGISDSTLEWVTPVLYLRGHDPRRGDDAQLFALPDTRTASTGGARTPAPQHPASQDSSARQPPAGPSRLIRTVTGHTDGVAGVAYSPDGTLLATAGDTTSRLWQVPGGSPVRTQAGHNNLIHGVAFSPDGTLLATCGADGARLWNADDGASVHALTGRHDGMVLGMAFSPDGTLLATTSSDKTIRLWDAASGAPVRTLAGHTATVSAVAFSPDGTQLATGSDDKTARLWG
jgi:CHAT domain/WD domain, G-beta repeat